MKITDQKLKELASGEWKINAVWSIGNQWRIQYVPSINQIPCVYSTIDYTEDDTYASNLDYEQIDFTLTDDQICICGVGYTDEGDSCRQSDVRAEIL